MPPSWADRPTIGLLGFVYPGKGHRELIDAAARQPVPPRVVAAGDVSPGCAALHRELLRQAELRGVDFVVAGSLTDADMAAAADAITVPVSPNRRVSASASLITWLSRGRRPLAAAGPYATEIDRRHPGLVHLYDHDVGLDEAVAAALADSSCTRLQAPPVWPDVGAAHAALYRRLVAEHRPC